MMTCIADRKLSRLGEKSVSLQDIKVSAELIKLQVQMILNLLSNLVKF